MSAVSSAELEARVAELLAKLSLEEKVGLLAGSDLWHVPGVPRLGIPPLKVTDGPNGARGASFAEGPTSACFPCGTALAASFDPELAREVGAALGEEARAKGARVLLGPTVNLHRHPLGGRHFECGSEDPHLASRISAAFVRGVQSRGVASCPKHFVCNDTELERTTRSSQVDPRTLHEIYLPAFEAAVREGGAWSLMAAYNPLNGIHCTEHAELLQGILKGEWCFDGVVLSDWFATGTTAASLLGGLDLEMPGPARHYGPKLVAAVERGEVPQTAVDAAARRVLRLMARTGSLDAAPEPERAEDRPEHRALARRVAGEAIVLLRNEGSVLPLDAAALRRIAVVGPNAAVARVQGGGSAAVRPHRAVSPLDGIRARLGAGVEVVHERGCSIERATPAFDARCIVSPEGLPGFRAEFFEGPVAAGEPVAATHLTRLHCTWLGAPVPGISGERYSVRITGTYRPPESGIYTLGLTSAGRSRLSVDGEVVVDHWETTQRGESFFGAGTPEGRARVAMRAGEPRAIVALLCKDGPGPLGGIEAGCLLPEPPDLLERAVACAAAADAAVVVVGTSDEWETEGRDRESLALPGRQEELALRVAAANPRTVVVVNAGAPVALEWAPRVPALVALWLPGQEGGHALADVLFGDADPGGRLPTTFPRRIEDAPAAPHYPGTGDAMVYAEGVFVGYRGYDARGVEPRFPFGHGLSYTRFAWGALQVPGRIRRGESAGVSIEIENVGARPGSEVVQLYLGDEAASVPRPPRELVGFAKLRLRPGERATARFELPPRAFAFYDAARREWVAEPGAFELAAGASSRDLRARARIELA
jgi:beta-glucosidase